MMHAGISVYSAERPRRIIQHEPTSSASAAMSWLEVPKAGHRTAHWPVSASAHPKPVTSAVDTYMLEVPKISPVR